MFRQKRRLPWKAILMAGACAVLLGGGIWWEKTMSGTPQQRLTAYYVAVEAGEYERMYDYLTLPSQQNKPWEEFLQRNEAIYTGIGLSDASITIWKVEQEGFFDAQITFDVAMDTDAGGLVAAMKAQLRREWGRGWRIVWQDSLIFPSLTAEDTVQVRTEKATRGRILDRNGRVLAGQGEASSVGLVPGKMKQDPGEDLEKLAALLEMDQEVIEEKLAASWVQDDSFVPLKTIEKVDELALISPLPSDKALENQVLQDALLSIDGVMIQDIEVREYPLREKASHLTGYVQNVTAEDLSELEGYQADSVIGRSGLESLYEAKLKGLDGVSIAIVDPSGKVKDIVARQPKINGTDLYLTIDVSLQASLYELFSEVESASVALNPETGEVLALVSTPSFNSNDFVLGLSQQAWTELNEDPRLPMLNRFRQTFCPGSTMKPIIAALGLTAGVLTGEEDFGYEGRTWRKDESWGGYFISTTKAYEPVTLENALKYSDNIYFAKVALKLGAKQFCDGLTSMGFGEKVPFPIWVGVSQFSNDGQIIDDEILLADSGYGQGQLLVNPFHMAVMYTAFYHDGDMIQPKLLFDGAKEGTIWKEHVFSAQAAQEVREDMVSVIESPDATGAKGKIDGVRLAGKTGTAELKATKDSEGAEIGWYAVMSLDQEKPLLIVTMVENVRPFGGCSYVVERVRQAMENVWYD